MHWDLALPADLPVLFASLRGRPLTSDCYQSPYHCCRLAARCCWGAAIPHPPGASADAHWLASSGELIHPTVFHPYCLMPPSFKLALVGLHPNPSIFLVTPLPLPPRVVLLNLHFAHPVYLMSNAHAGEGATGCTMQDVNCATCLGAKGHPSIRWVMIGRKPFCLDPVAAP
jgi:hypothetical protein|eukprot:CAMPEP_0174378900 /NCGR_PEP_ID=MMETSP0811_2-20130205/122352_1 /TAXON_ID=73025 ORGANISM="Eutreptiella gymnastica-like, Strain CCMP1594" /NCGR_SAMPLE_ID=MMETSP0811_2 /ASSEMBLY_ACC=CAM_ASM_000667 /LENGTH=170 /DNA_ID=CAMNT_0015531259 /DNA_START=305 /DNA_END=817 /DNA_ORIENTATION=-